MKPGNMLANVALVLTTNLGVNGCIENPNHKGDFVSQDSSKKEIKDSSGDIHDDVLNVIFKDVWKDSIPDTDVQNITDDVDMFSEFNGNNDQVTDGIAEKLPAICSKTISDDCALTVKNLMCSSPCEDVTKHETFMQMEVDKMIADFSQMLKMLPNIPDPTMSYSDDPKANTKHYNFVSGNTKWFLLMNKYHYSLSKFTVDGQKYERGVTFELNVGDGSVKELIIVKPFVPCVEAHPNHSNEYHMVNSTSTIYVKEFIAKDLQLGSSECKSVPGEDPAISDDAVQSVCPEGGNESKAYCHSTPSNGGMIYAGLSTSNFAKKAKYESVLAKAFLALKTMLVANKMDL